MKELTDNECMEFRKLPLTFNDTIRAAYKSGQESARKAPMTDDEALKLPLEIGGGYVSIIRQVEKFHGIE